MLNEKEIKRLNLKKIYYALTLSAEKKEVLRDEIDQLMTQYFLGESK